MVQYIPSNSLSIKLSTFNLKSCSLIFASFPVVAACIELLIEENDLCN